jgi:hypothetical protein
MAESSKRIDASAARAPHGGGAAVATSAAKRSTGTVSKVAWLPQGELEHGEWIAAGRRLGAIGRCSQWWVGDWIRYGTAKWGEKYAEAARVTGYDVASLRNMAWVASQFDLSLRSDKLTWSHHVLLAPLEPEQQRRWLERASEERLSVADLRIELRTQQGREAPPEEVVEALPPDLESGAVTVCPQCGHTIHVGG